MKMEWDKSYKLGVSQIDDQHQELFAVINKVLDAIDRGSAREEMAGLLKFLEDYVTKHFALEESLMKKHNYPQYDNHKAHHSAFMSNFMSLNKFFEAWGASASFVDLVEKWVTNWLKDHILKVDQELGKFLKSNNVKSAL